VSRDTVDALSLALLGNYSRQHRLHMFWLLFTLVFILHCTCIGASLFGNLTFSIFFNFVGVGGEIELMLPMMIHLVLIKFIGLLLFSLFFFSL
jgi:hypothetical protein